MVGDIQAARSPLVAKLSNFMELSVADASVLDALCANEESFGAKVNLSIEGESPRTAFVITHGMACRYRLMPEGNRQLLSFLIPGDLCDLQGYLLSAMDHSIITISPTRIAAIPREAVTDLINRHPRIAAALWWSAMQEEAMLRERIVSLGRRGARGRVAHILCELVWRQMANGTSEDHAIRLPLTQADLGDALGLSAVHVNRVLQYFRQNDIITLEHRLLTLLDMPKLQDIAGFTRDYLHLGGTPIDAARYLTLLEGNLALQREKP